MKPYWLALALAVLSASAVAQPLFEQIDSVELSVLNSQVAFVGRIESLERTDDQQLLGICRVEEAFKEEHREVWHIVFNGHDQVPAEWHARNARLLIAAKSEGINLMARRVINLSDPELAVWDASLQQLKSAKQVLDVVRDAVRRNPGSIEIAAARFTLDMRQMLMVPVDTQLEETVLNLLKSDNGMHRYEAALAMRFFKSESNIERLKEMFNDMDWGHYQHPGSNGGHGIRRYSVRSQAFETLLSWGVEVEKPVLDVKTWDPAAVTHFHFEEKPAGPADLEVLKEFTNIQNLNLLDKFDDNLFAQLPPLPTLQQLELGGQITEASVAKLRGRKGLVYLRLEGRRFSDACLLDIQRIPDLQKLSYWRTSFTDEGLAQLQAARPDLKIID